MYCSNCGTEIPDEANFCWKCGKPQKQGIQVDEQKWEICEIKSAWKQGLFSNEYRFWAEATGPNGLYNAGESPKFNMGATEVPWESGKEAHAPLRALMNKLAQDGWEPLAAQGHHWFSYKFRRRVK
jgi:hypothetical protein